ncbi:MAG: hypothetical protein EZS28_038233 [Streblomastix strix]|uniref:Uncharacterized protein n=1 Tax=Streblomastix strix TaxID=222440 RepID=A0A5J4U7R8_9EUKA|nr:MAG: hypothetical protein EZS28_038233 [Streblomastix strix]
MILQARVEERASTSDEQARVAQELLRTKEIDIQRLHSEIVQLRQTAISESHSISTIHPVINQNISVGVIDNTSQLENPDLTGQGAILERIGGLLRKTIAIKQEYLSIQLNKEIKDGIYRVEVRFEKCKYLQYTYTRIGIVKAGYKIPYPCNPRDKLHGQHMLYYNGYTGNIYFKEMQIQEIQQPVFFKQREISILIHLQFFLLTIHISKFSFTLLIDLQIPSIFVIS